MVANSIYFPFLLFMYVARCWIMCRNVPTAYVTILCFIVIIYIHVLIHKRGLVFILQAVLRVLCTIILAFTFHNDSNMVVKSSCVNVYVLYWCWWHHRHLFIRFMIMWQWIELDWETTHGCGDCSKCVKTHSYLVIYIYFVVSHAWIAISFACTVIRIVCSIVLASSNFTMI